MERLSICVVGTQLRKKLLPTRSHQTRVEQYGLGLLLQRAEIAAPIEPETQGRIETVGALKSSGRPSAPIGRT